MSVFTDTLYKGQHYMQRWPMKKELAALFPENRVIAATKLGFKTMPPLAILTVMMQYLYGDIQQLPASIAVALLLITLPMQGVFWLGKRSSELLPVSLANWYHELYQGLVTQGCDLEPAVKKPHYSELADILENAFKRMDKAFMVK
ncbi:MULTISPECIES: terminus macrodomain insulation protein YfbV [unclassified Moritella]|uniref:terminus macrodomain insulation protein YfbV n=1 Tax=unclassified Moritella TaxID=2637987 RepID=UPI001BA557D4|nr:MULTISPECIES: terminus macrodomain insulation protein YfbV [unclassified Moritella]QUM81654.1 DUF412 domain-containing protein [Moritella sp. 5]QUM85966.1 DUF412 domain-containing protein [Moritella sp. 28]QUM90196.1 DUF412 domain-containing protein [Moritella sp. 36]